MKPLMEELAFRVAQLERQGLRRRRVVAEGIDFTSNDYLGIARHPELASGVAQWLAATKDPITAPASRLLSGETEAVRRLEDKLARFKGTEASLFFSSGFLANVGLLTAVLGPADRAISDEANHASLIDGLRLAGCRKVIVPHLDTAAIENALKAYHPGGRTFLITESLFSMDGDIAPLDVYADLAQRHGAELIVDDAHATGLYGRERGSGLTEVFGIERRVAAITSTCGKALAVGGGFIAGPEVLIDYLVNHCRPFIFTTAVPPLTLAAVETALHLASSHPERRERVFTLAARLRRKLTEHGIELTLPKAQVLGPSPIVPIVLGASDRAVRLAGELQARGFDVRSVRPPTVPPGTARLRISVHADHDEDDIDRLAATLGEILEAEAPATKRKREPSPISA